MNRNKKVNHFIKTLKSEGISIALAESMTCGLAAHLLSTCKGTADVLKGSVVCYTPEVKTRLLAVSDSMIKKFTAESREVTRALANNLGRVISADVHAAITGLAAAGGSERPSKPVGTVFIAIKHKGTMHQHRQVFKGTPLQVREQACLALYDLILKTAVNGRPKRKQQSKKQVKNKTRA